MSFASGSVAGRTSAQAVRIAGPLNGGPAGSAVAGLGDINGDGFADVVVSNYASVLTNPPIEYVIFGKATGWSDLSLADLGGNGFRIDTASQIHGAAAPVTVTPAGDFNADGLSDTLVWRNPALLAGRQGARTGAEFAQSGAAIAAQPIYAFSDMRGVGDFNGDGYDDLVFGSGGSTGRGTGYLGNLDLLLGSAELPAALGRAVYRLGAGFGGNIGQGVAAAGDVNGDGFADLMTWGFSLPFGLRATTVYVALGRPDPSVQSTFVSTGGDGYLTIITNGIQIAASAAGDFNGDGYGDFIINNAVFYGGAALPRVIDASSSPGAAGFLVRGATRVVAAGDVNGDGYADLLAGGDGRASVILGRADRLADLDLATPGAATTLTGAAAGDGFANTPGFPVPIAGAGDVDGDGFADIVVGAPNTGGTDIRGASWLLFSQSTGPVLARGSTLADTLRGGDDADTLNGYGRNDRIFGGAGNDTLDGGSGNDRLDGGAGGDLAVFVGSRADYSVGVLGNRAILSGPDGVDALVDVEWVRFGAAGPVPLASLGVSGLAVVSGGLGSGFAMPEIYQGTVPRLQLQVLGSATGDSVIGPAPSTFFNLLGGDDAVQAGRGDDVLDGGTGSNFLTGGAGRDDFFLDGRSLGVTWSTITDWQAGETLSLFGWRPGVSTALWRELEGAAGYQGVTLHADLDGDGRIETSVTWSGLVRANLPAPLESDGLLWFT